MGNWQTTIFTPQLLAGKLVRACVCGCVHVCVCVCACDVLPVVPSSLVRVMYSNVNVILFVRFGLWLWYGDCVLILDDTMP